MLEIIFTIISVVFILDYYLAFFRSNCCGITEGLCKPCFGIFYPHLGMKTGALVWLAEFTFILITVWLWF